MPPQHEKRRGHKRDIGWLVKGRAWSIAIARCIEANPGFIKGFKLRLVGPVAQHQGEALVRPCKDISREHKLPLMVHIGDRPADFAAARETTRFLLNSFEPGDILTHLGTPHAGGVMADEARTRLLPELLEARARGVVRDPALGAGNFGFDVVRQQAEIGLHPDTIKGTHVKKQVSSAREDLLSAAE